jgi:hypothetical protein
MARFEPESRPRGASSVEKSLELFDVSWPVDFTVTNGDRAEYRACVLSPDGLGVRSPTPLEVGWLTELVVCNRSTAIPMLANVRTCEPQPEGDFLISLRPFGLAKTETAAWLDLLAETRPAPPPRGDR